VIVKISRGGRTQGLMAYLAGPGRSNEHESPHLVAGSPGLMAWYSTDELSQRSATSIGNHLDAPRRITGTEITTAVKTFDTYAGVLATGERRAAHAWHCSLSLPPGTEPLGDETWGAIAGDFAAGMGFTQASGKAPCRWAAVPTGASVAGGDHIHLAVALVREDGTKASTHNDYKTASRLAGELERRHGLEVVAGRDVGKSARPEIRAEVERAAASGKTETYSRRLGRTVRACATSSATEDEFVRRARAEGLWVRPRFAASVTGKAKRTGSVPSASSSTPSCCGTPATSTPPSPSSALAATPPRTPTSSGFPRSFTTTSTCSAATTSPTPTASGTGFVRSATHAPPTTETRHPHSLAEDPARLLLTPLLLGRSQAGAGNGRRRGDRRNAFSPCAAAAATARCPRSRRVRPEVSGRQPPTP